VAPSALQSHEHSSQPCTLPDCIYQCKTCNKALCSKCAINAKHRLHELEDFEEYRDALVNRINQAKNEIRELLNIEGLNPRVGEEKYQEANKSIDDRYEALVKVLKEARDQCKESNKRAYLTY
jgi:hypothetical protein